MCPLPRSPVTEADGCFMVRIPGGSYRIQGRGARFARIGGLPSVRCSAATPRHELTALDDNLPREQTVPEVPAGYLHCCAHARTALALRAIVIRYVTEDRAMPR